MVAVILCFSYINSSPLFSLKQPRLKPSLLALAKGIVASFHFHPPFIARI